MQIDWWTFALQAVNVLVLIWLLKRFLFAPVQAAIERRRAEEARRLDELDRQRDELEREREAVAARLKGMAAEGDAIRNQAGADAEQHRKALLGTAQAEIAQLHAAAKTAIEHDRQAADDALGRRAAELSVAMAARLLASVPSAPMWQAFLDAIMVRVESLTADERLRLASSGIEVVTANTPDAPAMAMIEQRLHATLGAQTGITFRTDPAQLGGMELRSRHMVVSTGWRRLLEDVQREVARQ